MKRSLLPVGAAVVAAAALTPGLASAQPTTTAHAHTYEHDYRAVVKADGSQAPGRNIIQDGTARGGAPSDAQTLASIAVLQRMLQPTPTSTSTYATSTDDETADGYDSAGAAGVPACASESGDDYSTGPDNTNAETGATGRYQIEPATAAGYGCDLATAAGQDACAQVIYGHQGASAWVGCGG